MNCLQLAIVSLAGQLEPGKKDSLLKRYLKINLLSNIAWLFSMLTMLLTPLSAQTLRVALTDNDYPPFYSQTGKSLQGFSVDILMAIADDIGVTLQWQRMPFSRVIQRVEYGQADLISVFYKTPQRSRRFTYSAHSYLTEPIVLLCAAPCDPAYDGSLASLGQTSIAVVRNFSYGSRLDQASFNKVAIIESDLKLVRLLANKRLEFGLASAFSALSAFKREQTGDKVRIIKPPLDYVEVYFAFSKNSGLTAELLSKFNHSLGRFKQTERYQALLQKYQLYIP